MADLVVRRAEDWLHVYDDDGVLVGSSVVGFGPHAAAAVDVAAALLRAVSAGMHE